MNSLEYLEYAANDKPNNQDGGAEATVRINLITNFTDKILQNILTGVSLYNRVRLVISAVPYKQYHIALKNHAGELYASKPDITFIFFEMNPYKESEFRASRKHLDETLSDVERYCAANKGTVILNNFIVSYRGVHGNLFRHNPFLKLAQAYNEKLEALGERVPNLHIFDTNRFVHFLGESHVFDLRGMHAFDIPFTHDFMTLLAEEWFAYIRALLGKSKKCIVVDLDNTLWGGVVGELGYENISLGPDYPGNAFTGFQRTLLEFYDRGIILAINSKNNLEDVLEVFEKNPHMVLKERHFAAIRANWESKADNLLDIAKELNIGTESMVFLDDDPVNRHLVKSRLPEVSVPEFSMPPEEYSAALYSLNLFHQFSMTEEDKQKGKMYAEERQRKKILETAPTIDDYIAQLGITVNVAVNEPDLIPRLSQLTLKTNQFNATTRRYSEHDVQVFIEKGAFVFSANVSDSFGDYGTVIEAIIVPNTPKKGEATLDTFLMSCRAMGRGVECVFIDHVIRELHKHGFSVFHALYLSTAKNKPAETFFSEHGFVLSQASGTTGKHYTLDIKKYIQAPCKKVNKAIIIKTS